jgi:DNA-binding NarL/FixJ family response regulator
VSSLAVSEPRPRIPAIAVAAWERSMQVRLASALAGGPSLQVSVASSLGTLVAAGAADDVIVTYHETLCSDDCELFKQVKNQYPDLLIVVVCGAADGRSVRRALDSGIDGLVFADELDAALRPTVAAALAGQIALPRNLRKFVGKPSLSAKERQVLRLLVMGFSNGEISARLFLAESTVKSHLSSAYTKLGVRSRSEAVSLLLDPKQALGTDISVVSPAPASSDVPRSGV